MKCHCFIQACLSGVIEIDKKIPFLKKLYPNSEIEKKALTGQDKEFVIVKDIVDDAKIADDVKQNIISWEEENIAIGQNMIAKIDKKLK